MTGANRYRMGEGGAGGLAWLGRHRLLLGGLAVLLVVAAVGAGYVVTRPPDVVPAVNPVVDVSLVGSESATSSDFDSHERLRTKLGYQLTAHTAGDVVTALGVVGPGLTDATSTISKVTAGPSKSGTLGATVDCSGSTWWAAKDADYRFRVKRTDAYGRVTTYDAPLGKSALRWWALVRESCLRTFFDTLPPAVGSASTVASPHLVKVTLRLKNPSKHNLWLMPANFADLTAAGATKGSQSWTPLPAGGTASVTQSIRAAGCRGHSAPRVPFANDPAGQPTHDKALIVYLSDTAVPVNGQLTPVWARLGPAAAARIGRQFAALCQAK
jgi:hypothetical protein